MKNIKKFLKENKTEIALGCIIGGGIAAAFIISRNHYHKNFQLIPKGLDIITWKNHNRFITLDKAKELIDLNATDIAAKFAIMKQGNNYVAIILDNTEVIVPQI